MKIKFEIRSNPKSTSSDPLFTVFMENKNEDNVEFLITKFQLKQMQLHDRNPIAQKSDVPIDDGILVMNKPNLKKFISALQLLVKA